MAIINQEILPELPAPPVRERVWTTERLVGNGLVGFWAIVAFALAFWLFTSWDPEKMARYAPAYFDGLGVTLSLVGISIVLGAVLSLPIAFMRMSSSNLLNAIAYSYVYFFRGTPLIAQLFLIYYGVGSFRNELEAVGLWGFLREAWNCALLAFTLNTAAYQAEILRGAIESVPKGQWEGGRALGLSRFQIFRKIIMPQAMIVALRPYGNEIILMVKGSAIVAIVTVLDLMGVTRRIFSRTFDFQTYVYAGFFYIAIVELIRNLWNWFEKRLTQHLKR